MYPSRGAWAGARHQWERAHGTTLQAWFGAVLDDARAFGLDALNEVCSRYLIEADEDEDPRPEVA